MSQDFFINDYRSFMCILLIKMDFLYVLFYKKKKNGELFVMTPQEFVFSFIFVTC